MGFQACYFKYSVAMVFEFYVVNIFIHSFWCFLFLWGILIERILVSTNAHPYILAGMSKSIWDQRIIWYIFSLPPYPDIKLPFGAKYSIEIRFLPLTSLDMLYWSHILNFNSPNVQYNFWHALPVSHFKWPSLFVYLYKKLWPSHSSTFTLARYRVTEIAFYDCGL